MGLETRGGVSFCASAQRAEGGPRPCRPRPQRPAPHPSLAAGTAGGRGRTPARCPKSCRRRWREGLPHAAPSPITAAVLAAFFPAGMVMPGGVPVEAMPWQCRSAAAAPGSAGSDTLPRRGRGDPRSPQPRSRRGSVFAVPLLAHVRRCAQRALRPEGRWQMPPSRLRGGP